MAQCFCCASAARSKFRHERLDVFDLDGFGRVVEETLGGAFR